MGRPIRLQTATSIYFVTNRCLQRQFLLKPTPAVRQIALDCLAWAAAAHRIDVFFFCFLSNHFHLGVAAPRYNLPDFMRDLQSRLAKKLNAHWDREGTVFPERYTASPLLDEAAIVDKLAYTICNPCAADLVARPGQWTGLSSWEIHTNDDHSLVGTRYHSKRYWSLRRTKNGLTEAECRQKATVEYTLELARLPMWAALDDDAYHARVQEHVLERAAELAKRRLRPCVGIDAVLARRHTDRPARPDTKPSCRPLCHAGCPQQRADWVDTYRETVGAYREAVERWRTGKSPVTFPEGTIPPGHLRCVGGPPRRRFA